LIIFVMLTDRVNHPLPSLLPLSRLSCPVSMNLARVSLKLAPSARLSH